MASNAPDSTFIASFSVGSVIERAGHGSDNFPCTWGSSSGGSDRTFTAYGDGWGFENIQQTSKEALGTAEFWGTPSNPSYNDLGVVKYSVDGDPSIKGTGILATEDNTLYMWTRRDGGSLWRSTNRGSSWSKLGISMEQGNGNFHGNHFLQFGKNYSGARDSYYYIYGTNQLGADNDEVYLYRTTNIENRSNYRFFTGMSGGNPTWSSSQSSSAPILTDTSECVDVRAVYNVGLSRYFLTYVSYLQWPTTLFAVFEAPEPWGPWHKVFYQFGALSGSRFEFDFPTMWHSSDGLTMYMVSSGIGSWDSFNVEPVTMTLVQQSAPPDAPDNVQISVAEDD